MLFLRCRRWGDIRLLSRIFTSGTEHKLCRQFWEHRPSIPGAAAQYNKEIVASNTVIQRLTNLLFYTISEGKEQMPVNKFINALKSNGLLTSDPRLKDCMDTLRQIIQESMIGATMDIEVFQKCVQSNIVFLTQIICKKLVIPDFEQFTLHINRLYENASTIQEGEQERPDSPLDRNYKICSLIPGADITSYSLEINFNGNFKFQKLLTTCSSLHQRHSVGDTNIPLCLQSCVKPLKYAIALNDLGTDYVHQHMGKEPSGHRFNKLSLNKQGERSSVSIVMNLDRNVFSTLPVNLFPWLSGFSSNQHYLTFTFCLFKVMQALKKMSGNEYVGFNNSTFQSEKETGDRNYAIGYYLKEKKVEVYSAVVLSFQLCSIEVTCESGSVIAATLANGGICPITGERVLSSEAVRNTLSLMHSCGMYDFSGQFAFNVGLPAKSGVSGAILLVVPNIMGVFCWSPPLDRVGNSVRGIHFCQELVSVFNFHNYDNLRHCARKLDPRKERSEVQHKTVVNLLFAAYSGDVSALRRFALSAMDMEQKDYDSRTALHVAAAEGHLEVVKFLIEGCRVNPFVEDRWGNTPLQEAIRFEQHDIVNVLMEYQESYARRQKSTERDERQMSLENLESMV
ncbi:glutaminase liver isoform, mitochondrial [Pyxicephalus adspersus]|uniref:glutaminase liver isoform, mitochondrial n=1 Tax=Pyxicephalus adspersus TaxID=30357 RepID=UPI003B5C8B14